MKARSPSDWIGYKCGMIRERIRSYFPEDTHAANHHEVRLVQLDFYIIEAKPENLIGDGAYDSDPLDKELHKDGIEMLEVRCRPLRS